VYIKRGLIAPSLDKKNAARILLRQQHVELLAAVFGARTLRVFLHQLDELIAVFGFQLKFNDDHDAAHRHFLPNESAASSMTGLA